MPQTFDVLIAAVFLLGASTGSSQGRPEDEALLHAMAAFWVITLTVVGVLRFVTAAKLKRFEGKVLTMVSAAVGLVSIAVCFVPVALVPFVGAIVLLVDRRRTRAFEMRAEGASVSEVRAWLVEQAAEVPRPRPAPDDGP